MERITGPHHGFYIASYASETGPAEGYLGYAKICRRRPESYWDANCLVKLCGEGLHPDPAHALEEAQQRAVEQLRSIAPTAEPALTEWPPRTGCTTAEASSRPIRVNKSRGLAPMRSG